MVASGLMYMESKLEFISVHGTSLLDGYKKVQVKKVHSGSENAKLPVPVREDLVVLIDAKDSYVQWPENHIHSPSKMEIVMKKKKKKTQRFPQPLVPTFLGVEVSSEFKQKLRTPLMNSSLLEARILKTSGALINVPVDDHILHLDQYTALISYEELIHCCDEGEIGVSHISIFMRAFEKRNSIDPLAGFEAKPLTWKIIKCPRQPVGSVLCGYYVCRYMLDLIKARYVNITPNFMLTAPPSYTVEQIDDVRNIWAEFTLNFKP
ncbi:uncharacterized protein LOC141633303 [Silene latifolia]|uniref:uncharacterized protein LOC141633303 n=1 Tax=Silene latifolia TaxID=37657 RepID=UPI003D78215C